MDKQKDMKTKLFDHICDNYGKTLLEDELQEIIAICQPPKPYPYTADNEPILKWAFQSPQPSETKDAKKFLDSKKLQNWETFVKSDVIELLNEFAQQNVVAEQKVVSDDIRDLAIRYSHFSEQYYLDYSNRVISDDDLFKQFLIKDTAK